MNISELLTNHLKGRTLIADVECYNSVICLMDYFKQELVKVDHVTMGEIGNTLYGIILEGENAGKECSMYFSIDTEFKFVD